MWGAEDEKKLITVDGELFEIHQNLYHFLRKAREHWPEQWLWIDAICIDQSKLKERNRQVGMMGSIYAQAKATLVYAGSGNNDIEIGLRVAQLVTASLPANASRTSGRLFPYATVEYLWKTHNEAYNLLCQLPYWDRAWIKQELLLSEHLTFLYGNTHGKWSTMRFIMAGDPERTTRDSDAAAVVLAKGTRASLISYLTSFKRMKCLDPRDRVFSLLGISSDGSAFEVDYSTSISELFIKILSLFPVERMLELKNTREILSSCLFDVHFVNLDLTYMQSAGKTSFLQPWMTTERCEGRVLLYLHSQDRQRYDKSFDIENLKELSQRYDRVSYSPFRSRYACVEIQHFEKPASPMPSRFCWLTRECGPREGRVVAVGSLPLVRDSRSLKVSEIAWIRIANPVDISFHETVFWLTMNTQRMSLDLSTNTMSFLELIQISMQLRRFKRSDTNLANAGSVLP